MREAGRVLSDDSVMESCAFCAIARGEAPTSLVCEDALCLAFVDLRQFHHGHVLVVPRAHVPDVRALDEATGAALMSMLVRVTRAVSAAFPGPGLSVWHSIGEAAHQEVPHLHFHVHPRLPVDGLLRVYPRAPAMPGRDMLDACAARLRAHL